MMYVTKKITRKNMLICYSTKHVPWTCRG